MTVLSNPAGPLTLALEGNVSEDALPEIVRLIQDGEQSRRRVVLDLGDVTLMDRVAVRFFASQLRRGIDLGRTAGDCPPDPGRRTEPEARGPGPRRRHADGPRGRALFREPAPARHRTDQLPLIPEALDFPGNHS